MITVIGTSKSTNLADEKTGIHRNWHESCLVLLRNAKKMIVFIQLRGKKLSSDRIVKVVINHTITHLHCIQVN